MLPKKLNAACFCIYLLVGCVKSPHKYDLWRRIQVSRENLQCFEEPKTKTHSMTLPPIELPHTACRHILLRLSSGQTDKYSWTIQ